MCWGKSLSLRTKNQETLVWASVILFCHMGIRVSKGISESSYYSWSGD